MLDLAKVSRPRVSDVVDRVRLHDVLDRARRRRAIWITAPPGAGKTTLVANWVARRRLRCVWYQVDEGDADAATFFYYLGLAMHRTAPRARPLPALTPEYAAGIRVFARRFFRDLCTRVAGPFVIVLDDYQELPAGSDVHALLGDALDEIPDRVTVLFASRGEPPPEFARARANGAMEVIGAAALRLTRAETAAIARLRAGGRVAGVSRLHARADGWAAGVVLMLAAPSDAGGTGGRTPQTVFDYFAAEILGRARSDVQRVLLETSFLPRVTPTMAEALTHSPDAGRVLADLARRGYFTTRHEGPAGPTYRFHPLFREFLRSRAYEALGREHVSSLHVAAATLLAEEGDVESAAELLHGNRFHGEQAWPALGAVLMREAPRLAAAGRAATLARWLALLPEDVRTGDPWLVYWSAVAQLPSNAPGARASFEAAFRALRARGDAHGAYVAWSSLLESHFVVWDEMTPLRRWIGDLDELRRQFGEPDPAVAPSVTASLFVALLYAWPDHPDLERWSAQAMEIARDRSANPRLRASVAHFAVQHAVFWSDVGRAREAVRTVRDLESEAIDPLTAICLKTAEAACLWFGEGDGGAAVQKAEEAVALADATGVHLWDFMSYAQGTWASMIKGDLAGAEQYAGRMGAMLQPGHALQLGWYEHTRGVLALRRGEADLARLHLERALAISHRAGMPYARFFTLATLGAPLAALGNEAQAERLLREAADLGLGFSPYVPLLELAHLALRRGQDEVADGLLRRALGLAHAGGVAVHPFLGPHEVGEVLAAAIERGIEVGFAREMARRSRAVPPETAGTLEGWPWALEVRTLGGFSMVVEGEPLRLEGRPPRRSILLLEALIALGGHDVRQERLAAALWPTTDPEAARHSLEMAIHRLRRLLGRDDLLLVREQRLTLDPTRVWVDALALDRLLSRASALAETSRRDAAASLLRRARELRRGPFVPGVDEPWAVAFRQRLEAKLARTAAVVEREPGSPQPTARAQENRAHAAQPRARSPVGGDGGGARST